MNDRILTTPNEVHWFAEKMHCVVCGGEMAVDEHCYPSDVSDTSYQKWYMAFIACSHHYDVDVHWCDPKYIQITREGIILDINDVEYEVARHKQKHHSNIELVVELTADGASIPVPPDWFDFDNFDADEFARKINAILLLK